MPIILSINKDLPFADEAKRELTFFFEKANQQNINIPDNILKEIGLMINDFNNSIIGIHEFSEKLSNLMKKVGLKEYREVQYA